MGRLILGTAGHIDHGKTALVKALTGVDTDRLKEEKERGITVDLGFAEFRPREDVRFGVVDVPGHEGFIRNMLAGATGVDVVLLVVAADEGVMPQTREHLAIVRLLGVPQLVVALTKVDLVEPEWLDLAEDDVRELLDGTPYAEAPVLPVSATSGEGLQELTAALGEIGESTEERGREDLARLPIDRVFTVRGAGTVVTGTLWSGTFHVGDRCRILPGSQEARIRTLQTHGREVGEAAAGGRVAVALTGPGLRHQEIRRGQCLLQGEGWQASWMFTGRVSVLEDTGWQLRQGQRVRVHLGTAEVLARAAILAGEAIQGGEEGWVQFRLEEPILARVRDHFVVRSYSPVTTLGGGQVAEVFPRKKKRLRRGEAGWLANRLGSSDEEALAALLEVSGWDGVAEGQLAQRTGFSPPVLQSVQAQLLRRGGAVNVDGFLYSHRIWEEGERKLLAALDRYHQANPLRSGMPLEQLRQVLPGERGTTLADALFRDLSRGGALRISGGTASLGDFRPTLTAAQSRLRDRLRLILEAAFLSPPTLRELALQLGDPPDLEAVLRVMESDGELIALDPELFVTRAAVTEGGRRVVSNLSGSRDLGPADFKTVLPLTRKHLLPLLRHFDTVGITTRRAELREVAAELPLGWGTPADLEK